MKILKIENRKRECEIKSSCKLHEEKKIKGEGGERMKM